MEVPTSAVAEATAQRALPPAAAPEGRECIICMAAPRQVRFAPCGHASTCLRCAEDLQQREKLDPEKIVRARGGRAPCPGPSIGGARPGPGLEGRAMASPPLSPAEGLQQEKLGPVRARGASRTRTEDSGN